MTSLNDAIVSLFDGARVVRATAACDVLVAFVTSGTTALPPLQAGALLRSCRQERSPAQVRALGIAGLYHHVLTVLEVALEKPLRAADDWSIEPPGGCACALCVELAKFLRAPDRVELPWPLAKDRRSHVHGVIDAHRLPVSHETIHRGSPHVLMLRKLSALFEQDRARRDAQTALVAWLRRERPAFAGKG